ncbi:hypothetical protein [Streptomyces sp. A1547]|uniref:hypothetical protein n=1 Tax=Streptomyces sp. A1547 TaxID=2563105 RepID=UPI00109ECDF4|nr:hypothetical protein [Streptomyces sp. A1547]THA23361.1 hypothetical protein E6W17_41660 [Streptomyces sp. A1547]
MRLEDVDWSAGRMWVITRGTGQRDPVPSSPQTFACPRQLIARIAEAEREGWLGEVEGLRVSLAGAE